MHSGRVSANARRAVWTARLAAMVLVAVASLVLSIHPGHANPKFAAIVVDGASGKVLHSSHANETRYPASLTKVMTLYILFEELRAGRLTLDSPIPVSANAAAEAPSKIGFKPGQTIRVRDAIRAMVTKSANDVATAVGEKISGSEKAFAKRMTQTARRLGMSKTTYHNAHGLPHSPHNTTTARDQAVLGMAVQRDFPVYYSYFSTRSFTYRGTAYRNHNRLLGSVDGVDGIKTGFINASGFNLLSSVKRDGRYIVAVVMGGRTGRTRNEYMTGLIEKYIPKATQGGAAMLARNVPVPTSRPQMPVVLASANGVAQRATEPEPQRLTPELIAAYAASVNAEVTAQGDTEDPVDAVDVAASGTAPRALALVEETPAAVVETAGAPEPNGAIPSGWHVQIAATESESGARSLLLDAQRKNASVLADRQLYTERVDVNGTTLYRARFTGFSSKSEAWAACTQLKRHKMSCWALNPAS